MEILQFVITALVVSKEHEVLYPPWVLEPHRFDISAMDPLLLIWFYFNPSIDK